MAEISKVTGLSQGNSVQPRRSFLETETLRVERMETSGWHGLSLRLTPHLMGKTGTIHVMAEPAEA
jgi:hypothetical protein